MFRTEKIVPLAISGSAIVSVLMVLYLASVNHLSYPRNILSIKVDLNAVVDVSSSLNMINISRLAKETLLLEKTPFNCPVLEIFDVKFPICLYPLERDNYVSKSAQKAETYWEKNEIGRLLNLVRLLRSLSQHGERDVVFVDMGTSIGTYSLPILHNDFKVVNLDAQWEAIRRYAFSVYLANVTDTRRVTILHNAVADKSGNILNMRINSENAGGSHIVPHGPCLTADCNTTLVKTITLNDLLPLVVTKPSRFTIRRPQVVFKCDIEGSESLAFTEESAGKFFEETDVILIQMELNYALGEGIITEGWKRRQMMLSFFTSRGYSIRDAGTPSTYFTVDQLKDVNIFNVLFVKKGLDRLI